MLFCGCCGWSGVYVRCSFFFFFVEVVGLVGEGDFRKINVCGFWERGVIEGEGESCFRWDGKGWCF